MVSPTGGVLAPATGVTAPALSTETAALGPETSALWPSPGRPGGTPAANQAQTPGPPPRRGGSGPAGKDENSTRQGLEEGTPSRAPGLVTGRWPASTAPGTTHSSPSGPTNGSLSTPGWLSRDSSTERPLWPSPTEGPTDHIVWDASLPTGDAAPAALDPTRPQNLVPGPSGSPDLPSAPTPESLKLPACGECLGWYVLGTRGLRPEHTGKELSSSWQSLMQTLSQSPVRNTQVDCSW